MNLALRKSCLIALLFVTGAVAAEYPGKQWPTAAPANVGLDAARLEQARDYALTGAGSGYIIRRGKLVLTWGDLKQRYDLKSTTKSFGATALGLAIKDGKLRLDDKARQHHPALGTPPESNAQTGWLDEITIRHLASQTAGFEKPGGFTPLLFRPGTQWDYSDSGPNWLAECITLAYRRDVDELMFERIFTPIGIQRSDLVWRKNAYRPELIDGIKRREFGSGISANVDAMARFGYLWLRGGEWNGKEILPRGFVGQARSTVPGVPGLPVRKPDDYGKAANHYGLLWWNNADGTIPNVPRDTYWTWGLYDSLIVVMPTLDIVVARAGQSWKRTKGADHYDVLKPFLLPIVAAAKGDGAPTLEKTSDKSAAPYPLSPVIKRIEWAPADTILRRAKGSDNWPMTWADDDALYTTYGDGNGFEPFVPTKLSLGLARVAGMPDNFQGSNLRSASIEQLGDGRKGQKGWGILSLNGVLYLWMGHADRNGGQAQLAWSRDHGTNWTYADWRFAEFGLVGFVNFGKDHAGARDDYVYAYSHDGPKADGPADRFILMRAPKGQLTRREAWQFFVRRDDRGQPVWSSDLRQRGAVFEHQDACLRSAMTYNAPLKRYFWWQALPQPPGHQDRGDTRFDGGFGVYDAPEPWGPWTTVYFTKQWDTGPGEHGDFPSKWMSADGRTVHLVFSGDDHFCVRKATLILSSQPANAPHANTIETP